jgi:hypothetical protein
MGFFKPAAFISGLAKGGLDLFDKAEKAGEEGLENLKLARDEVTEEISTMKDNYNKAIQIGDKVGGGAFAKYLFNTQDISYLAGLVNQTQKVQNEELSSLKNQFESLSENDKARFSDGDFSEDVKTQYESEVDALKVRKGLVNTNNMGEATANTLAGKVQTMVDRGFAPRREAIVSSVDGGKLKESDPLEGAYATIAAVSALKPFKSLNYTERNQFDDDFDDWYEDKFVDQITRNRKVEQDNVTKRIFIELRNAGFDVALSNDPESANFNEIDSKKYNTLLANLAQQGGFNTVDGIKREILMEAWFNETYPPGSYGDGVLSSKRNEIAVSGVPEDVGFGIDLIAFEGATNDVLIAETRNQLRDKGVDISLDEAEQILRNRGIIQ